MSFFGLTYYIIALMRQSKKLSVGSVLQYRGGLGRFAFLRYPWLRYRVGKPLVVVAVDDDCIVRFVRHGRLNHTILNCDYPYFGPPVRLEQMHLPIKPTIKHLVLYSIHLPMHFMLMEMPMLTIKIIQM